MSLKISKTNHEGFLKKWRNYGRTRPIGLLGSQTGDQKLTGYNVHVWKYTYIYICEHIYVDKNNYVYRLLPHFISVNSVCRDCLAFSTFVKCDILMLNHTTAFLFSLSNWNECWGLMCTVDHLQKLCKYTKNEREIYGTIIMVWQQYFSNASS